METILSKEDLIAIGCSLEEAEYFSESESRSEQRHFLEMHRKNLLERIHEEERQIITLDFLLQKMDNMDAVERGKKDVGVWGPRRRRVGGKWK